jgi:4-hydroxybenzoate polyprenyltransferase
MNTETLTIHPVTPSVLRTFSGQFIRAYLTTMRPYLMFVSGITGIAGLSLARETGLIRELLVAAAAFLSYGFGQALTDCFQTDTDSISSPYRPMTRGIVTKAQVLGISIPGLVFCVGIFGTANPLNFFLGALAGLGLTTYTPLKRRWWGGPFYNAWIVATLCVMAMLTVPAAISSITVWTLLAVFFGYANFVLSGYFKDITADRMTGYNTLPVVFGRLRSAIVSDLFAMLACVSAVAALWPNLKSATGTATYAILFAVAGIVAAVVGQARLHHVRTDSEAHRAISPVVHSYILLLSAITVMQRPAWIPAILAFYAAYVFVMNGRPEKSQI